MIILDIKATNALFHELLPMLPFETILDAIIQHITMNNLLKYFWAAAYTNFTKKYQDLQYFPYILQATWEATFILRGVRQEPVFSGINLAICILDFLGCLTRTVVRHDTNNNGWDESAVCEDGNNILARRRGRGERSELWLCRVNW